MKNNKFTKLAIATLMISTMENIVAASSDSDNFDFKSPIRLGKHSFQIATPETRNALKERVAQLNLQETPELQRKIDSDLAEKQGRLPESVLNKLKSTQLQALKSNRAITANQLLHELTSAEERAISKSKFAASDSEIESLIASLARQKLAASELVQSFDELAKEKARKEEQIKTLSEEIAENQIEMKTLNSANELEKNTLVETLVQTLNQHESELAKLTSEHISLQNQLFEKTKALNASELTLNSIMPLYEAVKRNADESHPSGRSASEEKSGVVAQANTAGAVATGGKEGGKTVEKAKAGRKREKVNVDKDDG